MRNKNRASALFLFPLVKSVIYVYNTYMFRILTVAEDEWLNSFNIIDRQHKIKIDGKIIKVDGYDRNTNTVYEFLGDYWHGHPNWYSKLNGINTNNKIPFVDLFEQTKIRFDKIKNLYYNIVYVWENDIRTKSINSRIFVNQLEV